MPHIPLPHIPMPHLPERSNLSVSYEAVIRAEDLTEWDEEVLVEELISQAPDTAKDSTGWVPDFENLTWTPKQIIFAEGPQTYENVNKVIFDVRFRLLSKP